MLIFPFKPDGSLIVLLTSGSEGSTSISGPPQSHRVPSRAHGILSAIEPTTQPSATPHKAGTWTWGIWLTPPSPAACLGLPSCSFTRWNTEAVRRLRRTRFWRRLLILPPAQPFFPLPPAHYPKPLLCPPTLNALILTL